MKFILPVTETEFKFDQDGLFVDGRLLDKTIPMESINPFSVIMTPYHLFIATRQGLLKVSETGISILDADITQTTNNLSKHVFKHLNLGEIQ